jgi:hypothetical protein
MIPDKSVFNQAALTNKRFLRFMWAGAHIHAMKVYRLLAKADLKEAIDVVAHIQAHPDEFGFDSEEAQKVKIAFGDSQLRHHIEDYHDEAAVERYQELTGDNHENALETVELFKSAIFAP